jgi:hypothetical protein
VIFSIKGTQSAKESFPAIRGLPKYLTGKLPDLTGEWREFELGDQHE